MKNEQRIWNKSELEQMPEWNYNNRVSRWYKKKLEFALDKDMIGKSVQWCKDQGFTVTPEMIAKTEIELIQEAVTQANDKLKERLDKGEIGITLENGTTLKVGEKYRLESWSKGTFIEILFIGEKFFFVKYQNGDEYSWPIDDDWLPYTEPKEEPKPLEGYQKWYIHLDRNVVKVEYMTIEQAEDLKSKKHILGVYTEQEAIDLGLVI
jgi:hypothetical protein